MSTTKLRHKDRPDKRHSQQGQSQYTRLHIAHWETRDIPPDTLLNQHTHTHTGNQKKEWLTSIYIHLCMHTFVSRLVTQMYFAAVYSMTDLIFCDHKTYVCIVL